ncbi:MAG TPA: hypothetical protein VJ729_06870 [Nitrososphaeraceae archaeon]|nr:hypothetical protein [Nitrososphaeraceae archaeon]
MRLWDKKEVVGVMLAASVVVPLHKEEGSKKLSTRVDVNIYLIVRLYWNTYVKNMKEN